uniref:Uncharacterized protein n=1 Tax=Cannabis sativa TaxID=3483 RepID=A0A803PDG1_CANSA
MELPPALKKSPELASRPKKSPELLTIPEKSSELPKKVTKKSSKLSASLELEVTGGYLHRPIQSGGPFTKPRWVYHQTHV